MAHPAIGYTLSAILLNVTAGFAPGLPVSNITNLCSTVIQSPSLIQNATLPAGYVGYSNIGVAYKAYFEFVTWKVARQRCISEGAQLAVIDTWIKFEFLMNQTGTKKAIWVGILRMYDDTEWVNANTGSPLTTLPWQSGEPSGEVDCVAAYAPENKRGLTNLVCKGNNLSYVCEVPIPGNYNG